MTMALRGQGVSIHLELKHSVSTDSVMLVFQPHGARGLVLGVIRATAQEGYTGHLSPEPPVRVPI